MKAVETSNCSASYIWSSADEPIDPNTTLKYQISAIGGPYQPFNGVFLPNVTKLADFNVSITQPLIYIGGLSGGDIAIISVGCVVVVVAVIIAVVWFIKRKKPTVDEEKTAFGDKEAVIEDV